MSIIGGHAVSATLEYQKDIGIVSVDASSNIGKGVLGGACALVASILMVTLKEPLILRVIGWLILGVIPFFIYELIKSTPKLKHSYEVNRKEKSVKCTSSDGVSESRVVGKFQQLQIFRVNPPGERNRLYSLQLVCEQGVIALFSLRSLQEVNALGTSLSEWLGIPLSPCQDMAFTSAICQQLLFPRYNPWAQK